jgi:hypothetical protein
MPNGIGDDAPVSWGRFTVTVESVTGRLADLENQNDRQFARIETNERAVTTADENRRALAAQVSQLAATMETRRQRTWTLVTILLTGIALPIMVSLILVWLHVRNL